MSDICSFGLCKLSDEELIEKVDRMTYEMYESGEIPYIHTPENPGEDYDLLVYELMLRFQDRQLQGELNEYSNDERWIDEINGI